MADCQFFGLKPWGHHLISVLLHALNTVLVFLFLRSVTGAVWRSMLLAALFGWHPLHVESVAWVSERKDVLSGFFGLLALMAYARYTEVQSLKSSQRTLKFFNCSTGGSSLAAEAVSGLGRDKAPMFS